MSLVLDSIATMGDPNASNDLKNSVSSISLLHSLKDWWSTPSTLQKPTSKTSNTDAVTKARNRNKQIEYDLFRAILSPKVEIVEPGSSKDPETAIFGRFIDTDLGQDDGTFIHEFQLTNKTSPELPQRHLVVVHGYMAALGYFVKNFEAWVLGYGNIVVHVIDMPGFGNLARPQFPDSLLVLPAQMSRESAITQVINVENWFVDKIEAWRKLLGFSKFDIVCHSMGAYLMSCYLMKYSDVTDVESIVLVSPMGTESSLVSLINNTKLQYNHHEPGADPLQEVIASQNFSDHEGKNEELLRLWEKLGQPKFPKNRLLRMLWEHSISPFQVLQLFGPAYSKILSLWSFQRFQNLKSNDGGAESNTDLILKLHKYSYSIFNQYQGLGELAITKLINHEILPYLPLCDRGFVEFLEKADIPSLWMYGDKDWMNPRGGEHCYGKLKSLGHSKCGFVEIKDAGHHIYLDNPTAFDEAVLEFWADIEK